MENMYVGMPICGALSLCVDETERPRRKTDRLRRESVRETERESERDRERE